MIIIWEFFLSKYWTTIQISFVNCFNWFIEKIINCFTIQACNLNCYLVAHLCNISLKHLKSLADVRCTVVDKYRALSSLTGSGLIFDAVFTLLYMVSLASVETITEGYSWLVALNFISFIKIRSLLAINYLCTIKRMVSLS